MDVFSGPYGVSFVVRVPVLLSTEPLVPTVFLVFFIFFNFVGFCFLVGYSLLTLKHLACFAGIFQSVALLTPMARALYSVLPVKPLVGLVFVGFFTSSSSFLFRAC